MQLVRRPDTDNKWRGWGAGPPHQLYTLCFYPLVHISDRTLLRKHWFDKIEKVAGNPRSNKSDVGSAKVWGPFTPQNLSVLEIKHPQSLPFTISRPSGHVHDPQKPLCLTLAKLLKIIQDESNASSEIYILQNLKNLLRWKHVCQSVEIHLINSWKTWIWDQYLPKNMKWKSCTFAIRFKESLPPPTVPPLARSNQHSDSYPCTESKRIRGGSMKRNCLVNLAALLLN